MTERNEPQPAPTAETPTAATATPPQTAPHRPWYRHVWVPVVGALILVLLAFGSGFVAGQATSLFQAVTVASSGDGPAWGDGGRDPGGRDGGAGHRDGGMPGLPGQRGDTDTE